MKANEIAEHLASWWHGEVAELEKMVLRVFSPQFLVHHHPVICCFDVLNMFW